MSYNLIVEGDLDLYELSRLGPEYAPLELFPIPASPTPKPTNANRAKMEPDALGVAIPMSRAGAEAGAALRALIELMWAKDAAVFDLYTGEQISTSEALAGVIERISG